MLTDLNSGATPRAFTSAFDLETLHAAGSHRPRASAMAVPLEPAGTDRKNFECAASPGPTTVAVHNTADVVSPLPRC